MWVHRDLQNSDAGFLPAFSAIAKAEKQPAPDILEIAVYWHDMLQPTRCTLSFQAGQAGNTRSWLIAAWVKFLNGHSSL